MGPKYAEQKAVIEGIVKRSGLQPEVLANRAGVEPETFRKVAKGYQKASERMIKSLKNAETAARTAPQLSVTRDSGFNLKEEAIAKVKIRMVPVISWASAGTAQDYSDMEDQLDEMMETDCRDENAFALIIEGDSMEPRFEAGDIVVFAPGSEPRNGSFVVARLRDGHGVLFKRYRRHGPEGGVILLESLNPHYKSKEYPSEAFHFIYPAVEMKARLMR